MTVLYFLGACVLTTVQGIIGLLLIILFSLGLKKVTKPSVRTSQTY